MKKSIIPIIALAILSMAIFSCGNDNEAMAGTWTTTSAKIESSQLKKSITALVEAEYKKTQFSFDLDGKAELKRGENVKNGVFSVNGQTLKLESGEGAKVPWSETYTIKSQSESEMTLGCDVDKKGTMATLVMHKSE